MCHRDTTTTTTVAMGLRQHNEDVDNADGGQCYHITTKTLMTGRRWPMPPRHNNDNSMSTLTVTTARQHVHTSTMKATVHPRQHDEDEGDKTRLCNMATMMTMASCPRQYHEDDDDMMRLANANATQQQQQHGHYNERLHATTTTTTRDNDMCGQRHSSMTMVPMTTTVTMHDTTTTT